MNGPVIGPVLTGILLLTGLIINNCLGNAVRSDLAAPVGMTKAQQTKLEEAAGASLFGQFRSNMADFLWMKVDKYLHSGVDLRGLTQEEKQRFLAEKVGHGAGGAKDGNREHHEETTIVLSKQHDWRGFLGDVERDIKPYMNMADHKHRDPKEALPLFRLMTWSNPHFIPGYATGAVMISAERKAFDEAIAFIHEGESNNPESIEIQETYAYLLISRRNSQMNLQEAAVHAERGMSLGKARDPKTLSADEREAWQGCARWRVLAYREMGEAGKARQAALEGVALFPDDVTCTNYLKRGK